MLLVGRAEEDADSGRERFRPIRPAALGGGLVVRVSPEKIPVKRRNAKRRTERPWASK